jgi:hypothetical protein
MWVSVWIENGRPVQVESNSYPEAIAVFQKWKESEANAQEQFLVDGCPVYFMTYLRVRPLVEGEIKCATPVATEDVATPKTSSPIQS